MNFPPRVSLTITNFCNLRCQMCGQWSENGYIRPTGAVPAPMPVSEWKRLIDEMAKNGVTWVLIRGGEPFLYPGILDVLDYLHEKRIPISIDTNGSMLKQFAAELVRIADRTHFTVSVDGPEPIHDAVRGVKGSFRRLAEGLKAVHECEEASGKTLSKSICFTISRYSLAGLGDMPDVARQLGIPNINIVPYYYFSEAVGKQYEQELHELGSDAYTWQGFQHEYSGVDIDEFLRQLRRFNENLGDVKIDPFLPLTEDEFRTWFADPTTPVGPTECWSLDGVIDIQPNGDANFCVDFPDYKIGNVRNSTIAELWNGERAAKFREARRKKPFAVCHRCGAKYMCAERDSEGFPITATR